MIHLSVILIKSGLTRDRKCIHHVSSFLVFHLKAKFKHPRKPIVSSTSFYSRGSQHWILNCLTLFDLSKDQWESPSYTQAHTEVNLWLIAKAFPFSIDCKHKHFPPLQQCRYSLLLEARNLSDFNIVKIQASIALVFHPPENLGIRGLFIAQNSPSSKSISAESIRR